MEQTQQLINDMDKLIEVASKEPTTVISFIALLFVTSLVPIIWKFANFYIEAQRLKDTEFMQLIKESTALSRENIEVLRGIRVMFEQYQNSSEQRDKDLRTTQLDIKEKVDYIYTFAQEERISKANKG